MATTDRYLVKMYGKKFQLKKLHDLWQRKSDTNVIAEDGLCVIRTILGIVSMLFRNTCMIRSTKIHAYINLHSFLFSLYERFPYYMKFHLSCILTQYF